MSEQAMRKHLAAQLKQQITYTIDQQAESLTALSQSIHASPELAFVEHKSSASLADYAQNAGLAVQRQAYGLDTALAAEFGDGGPCLAILSEFDALPGIGHACGHNIIAAAGVGAAIALLHLQDKLPGKIRWLATPAEERGCGKELMAQAGAFEQADFALMVHPAGVNSAGIKALCIADAEVSFQGRPAHAAVNPQGGLNALDAAVMSYQALAALRQHLLADDIINVVISEGGKAPNVIVSHAKLSVFLRAPNAQRLQQLKQRFTACVNAGAQATGCQAHIAWANADYLDFKLNQTLAQCYQQNAQTLGREFISVESLPAGGTDMGNVSHRIPSLHPLIACAPPEVLIHDPAFTQWAKSATGDKAVLDGAKALAMTAIDILCDTQLQQTARAEFAATEKSSAQAVASAYRQQDQPRFAAAGCC